jgi:dephospho-CoA kinase
MKIVGLTGSIGMGKSTVAAMLRDLGIPVFDADAVVHRLQGAEGTLVGPIEAAFPGTTGPDGVDRKSLGRRVFGDDAAMALLESLVHPAVACERQAFLSDNTAAPIVVLDIPLLFETGGVAAVDAVIVVSAPPEIQRARVLARPGMTEARLAAILARQTPDGEKRVRADYVVDTGVAVDRTQERVAEVVACLLRDEGR